MIWCFGQSIRLTDSALKKQPLVGRIVAISLMVVEQLTSKLALILFLNDRNLSPTLTKPILPWSFPLALSPTQWTIKRYHSPDSPISVMLLPSLGLER